MGNADGMSRRGNKSDYYVTPAPCVRALIDNVEFKDKVILDPCCGRRIFKQVFFEYKIVIKDYDILGGNDFFDESNHYDIIIMNPPYSEKNKFIDKALQVADKVYAILPVNVINYNHFHRHYLNIPEYAGRYLMTPKFFMTEEETENPKRGGISAYAWFYWDNEKIETGSFEKYIDLNTYFRPKTDCTDCQGWYNSCSPDDYPDYIEDSKHCQFFESKTAIRGRVANNT